MIPLASHRMLLKSIGEDDGGRCEHLSEHKQFLNRNRAHVSFLNEVVELDFSLLGLFIASGSKRRYMAHFGRWHCHRDNVLSHRP